MTLASGTRLGVYEIVDALGAGGMGEVYRARDTKLGRSVAIKILLDAVAADADRIARFEREARTLAALNHPRIAALFGLEEHSGRHFLVMELVEGETLGERIARGPLPIDQAIAVAMQIAEALEAAHEKGVVHRDLKPANVKITPDETVKVLDFGLSKAMDDRSASLAGERPGLTHSPTLSMMATQAGIILGTASYMSPEQAKGLAVDQRSDIFSFGVVLFEMLTGRQPFQGETAPEILASVLIRDADLAAMPPNLNPRLVDLVKRCLQKNPKQRWQHIGDVRAELETIAADPYGARIASVAAVGLSRWRVAAAIGLTAIVFAGIGGAVAWTLKPRAPVSVTRFTLPIGDGQGFAGIPRRAIAISPDGTRIAYSLRGAMYLRALTDLDARPVPGAVAPSLLPFFSSDGQWLGFYSVTDRALKKVAVSGGTALAICTLDNAPFSATWDGDAILLAMPPPRAGIMRVSANGGQPEMLVAAEGSQLLDTPQVIDRGNAVLYALATGRSADRWDTALIVVQSLRSNERKVVLRGGSAARYLPSGHLVYAMSGTLLAVPFDLKGREVRGGPVPILEGVLRPANASANTGDADYAVSDTGSLAYIPGLASSTATQQTLALVDRSGKTQPLALPPLGYWHPRVSPDGRQLAFCTDDGRDAVVWIYDLKNGGPARHLTFGGRNTNPIWTPDGRRITFMSTREGDNGIFWQRADGSDVAERLTKSGPENHRPEAWTPDGRTLTFRAGAGLGAIWTLSLDGDRKPTPLIATASNQHYTAFSPDGKWLAYTSSESGNGFDVFVQPFPLTGAKFQITTMGARTPVWSPDGRQLFFVDLPSNHMMGVDVRTEPAFGVSVPTPVLLDDAQFVAPGRNYDVTPDGKQFVVVVMPPTSAQGTRPPQQLVVVLNWSEELKQKVPIR
jgi:serine/threonine-protein kinase